MVSEALSEQPTPWTAAFSDAFPNTNSCYSVVRDFFAIQKREVQLNTRTTKGAVTKKFGAI